MNLFMSITTVVSAVATLVTVWLAYRALLVARSTLSEAQQARRETAEEQRRALEIARAAHDEQMAARRRVFEADVTLQRIGQVERIADILLDITDTIRKEAASPPPPKGGIEDRVGTRLHSAQRRLRAALSTLDNLGGPHLSGAHKVATLEIVWPVGREAPWELLNTATSALHEIGTPTHGDGRLKLPDV